MNKTSFLIIIVLLASLFLLSGCTTNDLVLPFTNSQFISQSTDLNYATFISGGYDGNCLSIDVNKITVTDCMSIDANIPWSTLIDFPVGCSDGQAVKIVGSSLVCVDLTVDTNYETAGYDLDDYVPYTGATTNVDLGSNNLTAERFNIGSIFSILPHYTSGLAIQGQSSGALAETNFFTKNGNGNYNNNLNVFGVGLPGSTSNRERLSMSWVASDSLYKIATEAGGTGVIRPLSLETEGNSNQVYLNTDGKVGVNISTPSELLHANTSTAYAGIRGGSAFIGNWANTSYAMFGHNSVKNDNTSYALLQSNLGDTYLNTASGRTLRLRVANSDKLIIESSGNVGIGGTPTTNLTIEGAGVSIGGFYGQEEISSTEAFGQGVGAGILLSGRHTPTGMARLGGIKALKKNGVSGEYGGQVALYSREHNGALTANLIVDDDGDIFIPNGNLGVNTIEPLIDFQLGDDYPIGLRSGNPNAQLIKNGYYNSGWKYMKDGYAWYIGDQATYGELQFAVANTGLEGNAISWAIPMTLSLVGNATEFDTDVIVSGDMSALNLSGTNTGDYDTNYETTGQSFEELSMEGLLFGLTMNTEAYNSTTNKLIDSSSYDAVSTPSDSTKFVDGINGGKAYDCAGGNYIENGHTTPDPSSINIWAKQTSEAGDSDQSLISAGYKYYSAGYSLFIDSVNNRICYGTNNSPTCTANSSYDVTTNLNKWRMFTHTCNNTDSNFYVDAKLIESVSGGCRGSPQAMNLGREASGGDEDFEGIIDEPSLWSRILTINELKIMFNSKWELPPPAFGKTFLSCNADTGLCTFSTNVTSDNWQDLSDYNLLFESNFNKQNFEGNKIYDASTNNLIGETTNTPTFTTGRYNGQAINANDINLGNKFLINNPLGFTMLYRINRTGISNYSQIIYKEGVIDWKFKNYGQMDLSLNGSSVYSGANDWTTGWADYALIIYPNGDINYYKDGVFFKALATGFAGIVDDSTKNTIINSKNGSTYMIDGPTDDIQIFERALSDKEIETHYYNQHESVDAKGAKTAIAPNEDGDIVLENNLYVGGVININPSDLLVTPVSGTIEYDGNKFYITNNGKQKAIDRTSDVALETVTCTNTIVETILWTGEMSANSLDAGNLFKFHADGNIMNGGASGADQITLRVKVGGVTVATLNPITKAIADGSHWHVNANATQRTIGVNGQRAVHIDLMIDDTEESIIGVTTIDTTNDMDVTITAQWASADTSNIINLFQGFMEYKN